MKLTEKETRDRVINPQLKSVGWTKEYIKKQILELEEEIIKELKDLEV